MKLSTKQNFDRYFGNVLIFIFRSLLSLKENYSQNNENQNIKFYMITTKSIKSFAETLNIFDKIYEIGDSSFFKLFKSTISIFFKIFGRVDTIVDLEVYSKLSTIFCLFTIARNRIAFYVDNILWKKYIATHLIYFNRNKPIFIFYEQFTSIFKINILPMEVIQKKFKENILFKGNQIQKNSEKYKSFKIIGIGHACSNLLKERMLSKEQWEYILKQKLENTNVVYYFFGAEPDKQNADEIIEVLRKNYDLSASAIKFINLCGKINLLGSIKYLSMCHEFYGIDSGLLHFARLLGIKTVSFWGPTDPTYRLKNFPTACNDEIYYKNLICSPCAHTFGKLPCNGNNLCMKNIFKDENEIFPVWFA